MRAIPYRLAVLVTLASIAAIGCQGNGPERIEESPAPPLEDRRGQERPPAATPEDETPPADDRPSPAEIERRIHELEAALARYEAQTAARSADDAALARASRWPQARQGREASRPAAATERPSAPQTSSGSVRLTTIEPAGGPNSPEAPRDVAAPEPAVTVAPNADKATARSATEGASARSAAPTLDDLIARYESLRDEGGADAAAERTLRVLYVLAGEDEESMLLIDGLSAEAQAVWRALLWTLITARDRADGVSQAAHAAEVLDAVEDLRTVLREQAPLVIGELHFCRSIDGFGSYEPIEARRFRPRQQVLLYSELRNFVSQRQSDGTYRVRLNETLSLERGDGTSVWQKSIPGIVDTCRQKRHDFFLTTRIPMPGNLPPGQYVLEVTFEDAASGKQARGRLDVTIAAP